MADKSRVAVVRHKKYNMERPNKQKYLTTNQREFDSQLNKYYEDLEKYVDHLEALRQPAVIKSVCEINRNQDDCDESDIETACLHCEQFKQTDL